MAKQDVTIELLYDDEWHPVNGTNGRPTRGPIQIDWGKSDPLAEPSPTEVSLALDWADGDLNPRNPTSPLYGLAGQSIPIRITLGADDVRAVAEIAELRPRRTEDYAVGTGRGDAWVDVVAAGVLGRLSKGTDPRSALWRFNVSRDPAAYWPMEDREDADRAASGLPGGRQMAIESGLIDFDDEEVIPGTAGYANVIQAASDVLRATVQDYGDQGDGWQVAIWAKATGTGFGGTGPNLDSFDTMRLFTSTEYSLRFRISNNFGTGVNPMSVTVFDPDGVFTSGVANEEEIPTPAYLDGQWHLCEIRVEQVTATTVDMTLYADGELVMTTTGIECSGIPARLEIPGEVDWVDADNVGVMHVAIRPTNTGFASQWEAGKGWPDEPASVRIAGVAGDRGVTVVFIGDPNDCQAMGPQYPDTTLNLFAEAERTDAGLLVDTRDALTLTYRTGRSMYAQDPALTLDFGDGSVLDPLEPVLGNQGTRNDVTVNRREGSSARAVQEIGPNNVQDPADDPQGVGRIVATIDINPSTDEVLPHHAAWWLAFGVVDEITFARVTINADALPGLAAKVSAVRAGDLIVIDNVPPDLSPDLARLIVIGGKERIDTDERTVTFNCVTASPYDVGVWNQYPTPVSYTFDSTSDGWAGEAGAVVARVTSPVHDGAGALRATRTMGAGFASIRINDAGQIPDDISGGGPMLAVWALVPGGAAGTDWAAHIEVQDATFAWQSGPNVALTPGAWALLTWEPPADLLSDCRAIGVQFEGHDVNASQAVYIDTVHSAAPVSATRYDTKLSSTSGTFTAGTDTSLTVASTGGVLWTTNPARYPMDLDLLGARVRALGCSGASSPQTMTIDSTVVNGVAKVIPSGAPVRLWRKRRYGL